MNDLFSNQENHRAEKSSADEQSADSKCKDCEAATTKQVGLYDFENMCCRLRFLSVLPTNIARHGWLEVWKTQGYPAKQTEIEYRKRVKNEQY